MDVYQELLLMTKCLLAAPCAAAAAHGVGAKLAVPTPGDVPFFHGAVAHGSLPNRSTDRFRRALSGSYGDGLVEVGVARD